MIAMKQCYICNESLTGIEAQQAVDLVDALVESGDEIEDWDALVHCQGPESNFLDGSVVVCVSCVTAHLRGRI